MLLALVQAHSPVYRCFEHSGVARWLHLLLWVLVTQACGIKLAFAMCLLQCLHCTDEAHIGRNRGSPVCSHSSLPKVHISLSIYLSIVIVLASPCHSSHLFRLLLEHFLHLEAVSKPEANHILSLHWPHQPLKKEREKKIERKKNTRPNMNLWRQLEIWNQNACWVAFKNW